MSKEYPLSFTATSTRIPECMATVKTYLGCGDWDETRRLIVANNAYNLNSESSLKRIAGELIKRLRTLSQTELELLSKSLGDDQKALLWVSVCRTYPFMRAFAELICERYESLTPVTLGAYGSLFDEEASQHPELDALTELTKGRLRNQAFRLAIDCHVLDESYMPMSLQPTVTTLDAIREAKANDLLVIPGAQA